MTEDAPEAASGMTRASGFVVTLMVQTVGGLVQTSGLLATVGPGSWAVVNVSQTLGLLGSTVVSAGLTSYGASMVASAPKGAAIRTLATLKARAVLYLAVALVLMPVAWWLAPVSTGAAALVVAAALLPGTAASWYFIGTGEPLRWLRVEVLPTVSGSVAGVAATWFIPEPLIFAACYLTGSVAAVLLSTREVRRDTTGATTLPLQVQPGAFLRTHRRVMAAAVAGGVNSQWPAILMAGVGTAVAPGYLLLDRLVKYAIAATAPVTQFAQSWIPDADPSRTARRARRTLAVVGFGSLAASGLFALVAGDAARLLSHDTIVVSGSAVALFAVLIGVLIVTQVNALAVLMPLGLESLLALSTSSGAVFLLTAGSAAALGFGLPGIVVATLVGESGILATQLAAAYRRSRRLTTSG